MKKSRGTQFAPPRWAKVAAALAVAAAWLGVVSAAQAAPVYVFEPTRSLTGDCSTSILDPVPDPGCPEPAVKPSGPFKNPTVTTDTFGDIYVGSMGEGEGRIDMFNPEGFFIGEFAITEPKDSLGPQSIAVDSEGNLYVFEELAKENRVVRYPPTVYEPGKKVEYKGPPVVLVGSVAKPLFFLGFVSAIAVDAKDRLYVDGVKSVSIFKSAKEGNELLKKEAIGPLERSSSIATDSVHKRIYISESIPGGSTVRVFEMESPYAELKEEEIDGSTTPKGEFLTGEGFLKLDVDDPSGRVFVGDLAAAKKVYEFGYEEKAGKVTHPYLATIEHGFNATTEGEINIDDGPSSPNSGYLFVPSEPSGVGHVYAFEPKVEEDPSVEARPVEEVAETDAVLPARINPGGLATTYRLDYITQQQYEEEGNSFANATLAGEGVLPASGEDIAGSAPAWNLSEGTAYRFRVFAENKLGATEDEGTFTTFEKAPQVPPCPNDPVRLRFSAGLPDCRAYELVTPADTNGHPPSGGFAGIYFGTLRAAPNGNRASFMIDGGTLPGSEGSGGFNGDPFVATRGPGGWTSEIAGPSGKEASVPQPGSFSPDQTYSVWSGAGEATFLRYPDGHSELMGQGSLGEDPTVDAQLITENADHVVFQSNVQLEENAPPSGTATVYDRSAEGPTHVVSLLPGSVTPAAKADAKFLGASEEGEGIAFSIGGTIYVRLHNEETFEVAGPGATFAGVADEGKRVFYLEGGDLFAFDATEEKAIEFSESGDVTPVNVAVGGTRAYFVSPSALTSEPNPNGEKAKAGEENFYLSEEGAISFVGIVTERDVEGEKRSDGLVGGLGLWQESLVAEAPAKDPSRTTPSGATLLFESRADLTGFESEGFAQVYRYDSSEGRLDCLSCSPTGAPPGSDASLQSISEEQFSPEPGGAFMKIPNQSPDGKRAFFQTAEQLVLGDTDKRLDVYEWEKEGVGSCEIEGGCTYLISGSHSTSPDYLYAMSSSGDDVFFRTADQLLPRDVESTLSIYDARVEGGFDESPPPPPCEEGEICKPTPEPPPVLPTPANAGPEPPPPPVKKTCPKGKHKAKRHGKTVCVKNHHKKNHQKTAGRKGGAK